MSEELPTIEAIRTRQLVEGDTLDFKRQLDLETETGRIRLVDDVVSFLNSDGGQIVAGVNEANGAFESFAPWTGDRDQMERRLLSILQTSIEPTPLEVRVHFIDVSGGDLICISVPPHHFGPYQNRITGAFRVRTGSKNTPIPRDALRARFVDQNRWTDDLLGLTRTEGEQLEISGRMTGRGPVLRIGILPRQHYDASVGRLTQHSNLRHPSPSFGDLGWAWLEGCEDGHEAIIKGGDGKGYYRLFIRDDWFTHVHVAWPIQVSPGDDRPTLHEFKIELATFLKELAAWFVDQAIDGPFAVSISLTHLQRTERVGWVFREVNTVRPIRPIIVGSLCDERMIDDFNALLMRSTRWGG